MTEQYDLEIGVTLLVAALVAAAISYLLGKRNQRCRWRRAKAKDKPALRGWVCRRCGEEAYSQDRKPPKECKRPLRNAI